MATMDGSEPLRSINRGAFAWRVAGDIPETLLDRLMALRTGAEEADGEAVRIIKSNPKRKVFRIEHEGRVYFAKWHRPRGLADSLLALFRGTRAKREWDNLRFLADHDLPVVPPVVIGTLRSGGLAVESMLVTASVDGESLRASVREGAGNLEPLAKASGELIRRVHDAGLNCPDLHSENLLVGEDGELCLLDVHAAHRCAGGVGQGGRVQNLGFLFNSFNEAAAKRAFGLAFLGGYLGADAGDDAIEQLMRFVMNEAARLHNVHLRSRSRRCMVGGSEFTNEGSPLGRVYRKRTMSMERIQEALTRHHAALAGGPGEVAKRQVKTQVTIISCGGNGDNERLCVKQFLRPALSRLLPKWLRHQNAIAGWKASLGLRVRGIQAPEALAVVVGKGLSSYLVMRAVEGGEWLSDAVARECASTVSARKRRVFLRAGAESLCNIFRAQVAHDDMKPTNVLVRSLEDGPDASWEFVLLDLDAVRFPSQLDSEHLLLNLAQLSAGLTLDLTWADRARFLRMVAGEFPGAATRESMKRIGELTLERTCAWR
jgi:tRNA A-37 threonylcarbamoyl transferase component Bud32